MIALAVGVGGLLYATPASASGSAATTTSAAANTEPAHDLPLRDTLLASYAVDAPRGEPTTAAITEAAPATTEATPAAEPSPSSTPASAAARATLEASATATAAAAASATAAAVVEDGIVRAASASQGATVLGGGTRVAATVSYYYCTRGSRGIGDGGGFCGAMRDGTIVYEGAAACAYAYLGQRFRIEGDPLGLVYRCADTGNLVGGQHRDIWFATSDQGRAWLDTVGRHATIEILP